MPEPAAPLPPCPHLPPLRADLDWRTLHVHRGEERAGDFYFSCLEYGQTLWSRRLAARSLLCLDRALGADLTGAEPILAAWPLPYAAMAWCLAHTPDGVFVGNPRVHFQHYAGRMNEPRREQRRWRAWACWALARAIQPQLPGDPRHAVREPSHAEIAEHLARHGHPGEPALWQGVLASCVARPSRP